MLGIEVYPPKPTINEYLNFMIKYKEYIKPKKS